MSSNTPRTDKAVAEVNDFITIKGIYVHATFARKLELELSEAYRSLKFLRGQIATLEQEKADAIQIKWI